MIRTDPKQTLLRKQKRKVKAKRLNAGKPKRPTRKKLIKLMDALVSKIVIARDGRCVCCIRKNKLTCGHYVKRGKIQLRWDLENCNCQCAACNYKHNNYPEAYTHYMLRAYGPEKLSRILAESYKTHVKMSMSELLDIYDYLKSIGG